MDCEINVLWATNTLAPDVAKKFGVNASHAISWVDAMSRAMIKNENIQLFIAAPAKVTVVKKQCVDNIIYYVYPYNGGYNDIWSFIIKDSLPDVIHVYGTEYKHNCELIVGYSDKIPLLISLQGLLSEYKNHYYAGMTFWDIISSITIGDVLLGRDIFSGKRSFVKRAKYEREAFKKAQFVEGRSNWDRNIATILNKDIQYFNCPRMLREPFYRTEWDYEKCEKYSVFVNQGSYPIKGFHYLIKAIAIVKERFPHVKLYISGSSFVEPKGLRKKLSFSGYSNYLRKMIKKLKLNDVIVFTDFLSAEDMANKMSEVNVCVNASAIENAPNAVAEAMIVGTPCIASFVGGTPEMLNFGECGTLYAYDDVMTLAGKIMDVFYNKQEIIRKSESGKCIARKRHDPTTLEKTLIDIYSTVIKEFKKNKFCK